MDKGKRGGVQRLPRNGKAAAVEVVAHDRAADRGKVHAQLMRAPGFRLAAHHGDAADRFRRFIDGHGVFARCAGRVGRAQDDALAHAADVGVNHAGGRCRRMRQQREVGFFNPAVCDERAEALGGVAVLCHKQDAAGVRIEAVDCAEDKGNAPPRKLARDGVCQRVAAMPVRLVRGHVRRFRRREDEVVLK